MGSQVDSHRVIRLSYWKGVLANDHGSLMLGTFQHSSLRIEVDATASQVWESLVQPEQFKRWLWPQQFTEGLPDVLTQGQVFKSYLGPIAIQHEVKAVSETHLYLLMSGGVDGFHEWYWGDGWVQSRLEGISVMPLNLAQSLNLWRLKQFLSNPSASYSGS